MAAEHLMPDLEGLPFDIEAEQAVLGSILIDPPCINQVIDQVKEDYFYLPQHKQIYHALATMMGTNERIDFVTVLNRLKKNGVYDEAGGKNYIQELVQSVGSSANLMTYVGIVRERYYARALIEASRSIIKEANENRRDAEDLLNSAEQKIYDIREGSMVTDLQHIKTVLENETFDRLTKITNPETRADYIGIPCGIEKLDKMITGLNKSDLIILGARPAMGKTSFALNIARNVAMNAHRRVAFFSLEMTRDQLAQRLLSSEAAISSEKLRTGELESAEWTRLSQAAAELAKAEIYFDESSGITVPEMKAKLMRQKVDLCVVDYLGLMHSANKIENRVQEISEITRGLKIMAKELKIPVIVCAQLSRGTEGKGVKSHRPGLADLRDSGSIEQDADIVLFLYRDVYYDNEKAADAEKGDPNKAECIVAKNRHGETGTVYLYWDGQHTRFTSPLNREE